MTRGRFTQLFVLGLALRLPGLLFNGMADLYQMLLDWGASVVRDGLVDAFAINYGIFSYAMFGTAAWAAELLPRFWWAPYKIIILAFDTSVLFALLRIVPVRSHVRVLWMYWLNPWFAYHQAYLGFWEAPHIWFGLLAVIAAERVQRLAWKWVSVGALLACSAMFKPQGLIHFLAPLGLYLGVEATRSDSRPLAWFTAGAGAVVALLSAIIVAAGGPPLALVHNYRSIAADVGGVSNGNPGIWRFFAFVYMVATGQSQTIPFVNMPRSIIALCSAVAALVTLGIQTLFALRVSLKSAVLHEASTVLAVLAFGSLVMSQFGVRAHINHSYGAMVLLIPLAVSHTRVRALWIAMCVLLGVSHILVFGLGHAALLIPENLFYRYPAAAGLIEQVTLLPAYTLPDWPLRVQLSVNRAIGALPGETIVSLLSIGVFVLACLMVKELFTVLRFDRR